MQHRTHINTRSLIIAKVSLQTVCPLQWYNICFVVVRNVHFRLNLPLFLFNNIVRCAFLVSDILFQWFQIWKVYEEGGTTQYQALPCKGLLRSVKSCAHTHTFTQWNISILLSHFSRPIELLKNKFTLNASVKQDAASNGSRGPWTKSSRCCILGGVD